MTEHELVICSGMLRDGTADTPRQASSTCQAEGAACSSASMATGTRLSAARKLTVTVRQRALPGQLVRGAQSSSDSVRAINTAHWPKVTQMSDHPHELKSIVDSHVHHWDPVNVEWYPQLNPEVDLRLDAGDRSAMARLYTQDIYLAEAVGWPIETYVHVSAAFGPGRHLAETEHIEQLSQLTGSPGAIIGAVDPGGSLADIAAELDQQACCAHFRGIRIPSGLDYNTSHAAGVLNLLAARELVYDLLVHPDSMMPAVRALEDQPDLSVVVEHCGWPRKPADPAEIAMWRAGVMALAARPRTVMKISGLPLALHTFSADRISPWFDYIIEAFGPDRCMFGSNFPVDGLFGSLDELFTTYEQLSRPLGADAQAALFADTARSVYLGSS